MKEYNIIEAVNLPVGTILEAHNECSNTENKISRFKVVKRSGRKFLIFIYDDASKNVDYVIDRSNDLSINDYTSKFVFTKIQKPLTFFEAMTKADKGDKVTNSYVLDGIEKDDLPKGYWYKGSKGILVWHDIEDCYDRYDVYLLDKELQSNWYIYEE